MKQSSSAESEEGRESGVENVRRERESNFFREIEYGYFVTLNAFKRSVIYLNLCSLFCSLNISVEKEHGLGKG